MLKVHAEGKGAMTEFKLKVSYQNPNEATPTDLQSTSNEDGQGSIEEHDYVFDATNIVDDVIMLITDRGLENMFIQVEAIGGTLTSADVVRVRGKATVQS